MKKNPCDIENHYLLGNLFEAHTTFSLTIKITVSTNCSLNTHTHTIDTIRKRAQKKKSHRKQSKCINPLIWRCVFKWLDWNYFCILLSSLVERFILFFFFFVFHLMVKKSRVIIHNVKLMVEKVKSNNGFVDACKS